MDTKIERPQAFIIWLLASLFFAYQYVIRVLPNLIMPDVMEKFQIEAGLFGQFSGVYYIGYAAMHIPVGMLLDKIGPRKVLPILILCTCSGLLPLIFSDTWTYPVLGRALIGMGSTGAALGIFKIVRMVYPESKFARMSGFSLGIGFFGAIYGGQPMNYLMTLFGWETVIMGVFFVGVLLALCTYIAMPVQKPQGMTLSNIVSDIMSVIFNYKILTICLLGGCMVGPMEGFADVWGAEYLKNVYHYSDNWGSTLPSFLFLGIGFGAPLLAYLAEKTNAYYGWTIASGAIMALCFVLLLAGLLDYTTMMIAFTITGFMAAYQIIVIYLASTYAQENTVGLTTACANMIIMIFGYVFHSSIGGIMRALWDGAVIEGVPVYSHAAYTTALSIIPIGLTIGTIGFTILSLGRWKDQQ